LQDINLDLDDIFAEIDERSCVINRDGNWRLLQLSDSLGVVINFDWEDFDEENLLYIQKVGDTKKYTITYGSDGMVTNIDYS
jgi:hypothetical protein